MLPEQKDLILKHFPELVQGCDLEQILNLLVKKGDINKEIFEEIKLEDDKYHNNRCILFKLLESNELNTFPHFIEALKETGSKRLAAVLEDKLEEFNLNNNPHPLDINIDVKLSTQFYDTSQYNKTSFYSTRSKNRGHVLIINNIQFISQKDERHGAEADEQQLTELFEKMGFTVFVHRNLTCEEMYQRANEFSKHFPENLPDIGIVIIMSHGLIYKNESMIISSDNKMVPEDNFRVIFNNENCALFRKKPKIFVYHICREVLPESAFNQTVTDANLASHRTYSDMLICHPSVDGFAAHRNYVMGSWYIQMLCKVFMNHAHEMDIESLLKKVDEELEMVSSLPWQFEDGNHITEQTSTFQNIAFKRCYINPGIYEEDGKIKQFN